MCKEMMNIESVEPMTCPSNLECPGSDFLLGESRAGQMGALHMKLSQAHLDMLTHPPTSGLHHCHANQPSGNNLLWGERHSFTDT